MSFIKLNGFWTDDDRKIPEPVVINTAHIVMYKPETGILVISGIPANSNGSLCTYSIAEADSKRLMVALGV